MNKQNELYAIRGMFNIRMPMRDNITLAADVILPEPVGRYPTILIRTPYLRTTTPWLDGSMPIPGVETFVHFLASHGYAVVMQDVRGRGDSEGTFQFYWADAEDGYDSIEWLAKQPWSTGRIGMMGPSYMGGVQWLAASQQPPHLKCMVSTAASGLYMEEAPYTGGAWNLMFGLMWLNGQAGKIRQENTAAFVDMDKVLAHRPLITQDEAYGRQIPMFRKSLENGLFNDEWQKISLSEADYRNIDLPVMHVSGWFDGDQPGVMHHWDNMQTASPARDQQFIVIGPWEHVQTFYGGVTTVGEMTFGEDSIVDSFGLHKRFFDHYLKQSTDEFEHPRARVYMTGLNEWRSYDQYPPPGLKEKRLYLHSDGNANSLSGDGSLSFDAPVDEPVDQYVYDPKDPAPSMLVTEKNPSGMFSGADLKQVDQRKDVLVYTSDVLETNMEVFGPVIAELFAASDALDTDWVVRIEDVYPDGRSANLGSRINGAILRARFRQGYEKEVLLTPGKPEKYSINIYHIGHTFLKGHRIRLHITSSSFPAIAPNQNTGNPVATDTEWRTAYQTVYHDTNHPSAIILPVA